MSVLLTTSVFSIFSLTSCSAGDIKDDPRVSGPRGHLEHGPAAPCRSRAVLLHFGSQWWNGLHACRRARRLADTETSTIHPPVFCLIISTERPRGFQTFHPKSFCVWIRLFCRYGIWHYLRVRWPGHGVLEVAGTPPLHHHRGWNGLHKRDLTAGSFHYQHPGRRCPSVFMLLWKHDKIPAHKFLQWKLIPVTPLWRTRAQALDKYLISCSVSAVWTRSWPHQPVSLPVYDLNFACIINAGDPIALNLSLKC